MPIFNWSTTAADNDDADAASGVNWMEGMAAGQVNNSARAMMAQIREWTLHPTVEAGGVLSLNNADNTYAATIQNTGATSAGLLDINTGVRLGSYLTVKSGNGISLNNSSNDFAVAITNTGGSGAGLFQFDAAAKFSGAITIQTGNTLSLNNSLNDYAATIVNAGTTGQGVLDTNVSLRVGGHCSATADNTYTSGTASLRWSVVYAGTSAINTSDATLKTEQALSDAVLRAVYRVPLRAFKFNDAIALKGAEARVHYGYFAQDVAAELTAEGIDPSTQAFWCEDTLGDGSPRQGLRYEEFLTVRQEAERRVRAGTLTV